MKILCFGDSNTYGYDPRSYFGGRYPEQHRWVDLLSREIGYTMVNAGENGCEIPWAEWELSRFKEMLNSHRPVGVLIIMLGTNDLLQGNSIETVVNRMERFLENIRPEMEMILLIAPPKMQLGEWVSTQHMIDSSAGLSLGYRRLCKRLDVPFVDATEWNVTLTFDGVHFSEEGHRAFAEGLANYLKEIKIC